MDKSSAGVFVVIIIVLAVGIGAYFMWPSGKVTVITPPAVSTTTVPVVTPPVASTTVATTTAATSTPFMLSDAQKAALIKFGISTTSIPTTITMDQQICLDTQLGASRSAEFRAGAVPTAIEFAKVQTCIWSTK